MTVAVAQRSLISLFMVYIYFIFQVSVWNNAVIRGDGNYVRIKAFANIQDSVIISTASFLAGGVPAHVVIGRHSSIGAKSVLRSCVIENECYIGERCIVQEGSVIEQGARLASGTVVPPNTLIPAGTLYAGNPATFIKMLSYDEKVQFRKSDIDAFIIACFLHTF